MRALRVLGIATAAVVLLGGVSVPAQAVAPVPVPSVALPPVIDLPSFYEAQRVCDPTAKPGATALGNLLVATYGPATIYIPRSCSGSTSEHFDGRAVDWMRSVRVPAQAEMAETFVAWLLAPAADGTPHEMARRLGIMYVIWNNRMIRMYDPGRGWTEYRGCLDPANSGTGMDTSCHRNHVHLSLSWDGAAAMTSWWTGVAQTTPYCHAGATPATPRPGTPSVVSDLAAVPGLVPVPPVAVLDTAAASGAGLVSPCRLLAGRTLYPSLRGAGLPPDASWAAVQVATTSNAPGQLLAWSAGGTRPAGLLGLPIGAGGGTVLAPIASDGTLGLATTLGAATVRAQLVGYVRGEPGAAPPPTTTPVAATGARPSRPRAVSAKSARRAVTTRWKAPKSAGGSALTGYQVQALASRARGAKVLGTCTAAPTARRCTIKGLAKGKRVWVSVSVANAAGATWAARRVVRVR